MLENWTNNVKKKKKELKERTCELFDKQVNRNTIVVHQSCYFILIGQTSGLTKKQSRAFYVII